MNQAQVEAVIKILKSRFPLLDDYSIGAIAREVVQAVMNKLPIRGMPSDY